MKQVRLTSYGFIRDKEYDFNDDGNTFKVYFYKDIVFSYLRKCGKIYLAGRFDDRNYKKESINIELKNLGQEIDSILYKYNGVTESCLNEEKLTNYVKELDEVVEKINLYENLEKSIQSIEVYKFQNNYLINKLVKKDNYSSKPEYELKLSVISERELKAYESYLSVEIKELTIK